MKSVGVNDGKFGAALRATRASSKGSPVAPGSAVKIKADNEVVLYSVVALKGQHEAGCVDEETGSVLEGKFTVQQCNSPSNCDILFLYLSRALY